MKNIITIVVAAGFMAGVCVYAAEPSHISAKKFQEQYRLGHMQTMKDSEFLGQKDGQAYLRIKSMSLTDPKQWSEQIVYVKLSELDKDFRDKLPAKEYQKP
jgi:hypothetical protein